MIVLDIAIGLVLIYFLYSLLSSIIAEMLSSWIGMRARMLRQGIDNILNDKKTGTTGDFRKWLEDIFLIEDKNFKYTTAGKFYEEPNIKYLAKPGEHVWYSLRNRKPSYISQEHFVITLLNMLSKRGKGVSEWDKIKFTLETNALHFEPETLKLFQDMVKRSDDRFECFVTLIQRQYSETMDRLNGWYKRKISTTIFYLGLVICAIFNVDTIEIVQKLSNDSEKRAKMVEIAEKAINQKSSIDSLMTITDTIDALKYKIQAHSIVKNAVLETNNIMAMGWNFNTKPVKKIKCVSNDPKCLDCLKPFDLKKFNKLLKEDSLLRIQIRAIQYVVESKFPEKSTFLNSSVIKIFYKDLIPFIDTTDENKGRIDYFKKLTAKDIKLLIEKQDELIQKESKLHDSLDQISGLPFTRFDSVTGRDHNTYIHGEAFPTTFEKSTQILNNMLPWKSKFWGIIITALALTLGAQFWFDLLKKLVSLRSAGIKPEEKEDKLRQLENLKITGDNITSRDPIEIVISENRKFWESLPGFIGYNIMMDDYCNRYVEVSLDEDVLAQKPVDEKKTVILADTKVEFDINIKYKLFGKGTFENNSFNFKGAIKQSETEAIGTPAGIVMNNRTGRPAILTCGHVARIDRSSFINDVGSKVYYYNGRDWKSEIGNTTNIVISSFCDGGLIDITNYQNNLNLRSINNFREANTLLKSEPYKLHSLRGSKNLNLYTKTHNTTIKDTGGHSDLRMFDLLVFEFQKKEDYSEPGDSGSLVTDANDFPIGIHIAGYETTVTKFCYVVKMKNLMEILQISPIKNIKS